MSQRFVSGCVLAALLALPYAASATNAPTATDNKVMAPASAIVAPNHGHTLVAAPADSASTIGYKDANAKMHGSMAINYSGDADVDFVRGMIPHHQGAIDMARVLLAHGKDAELQKLGNDIIAAQTKEIAQMQAWLAAHDKAGTTDKTGQHDKPLPKTLP